MIFKTAKSYKIADNMVSKIEKIKIMGFCFQERCKDCKA